jgi:hypothetical protein
MRADHKGQSALLLLDVIDLLAKEKLPYVVVGAFAASFYGVVRASLDADAVISLSASVLKEEELMEIFLQHGLNCDYRAGDSADPLDGVFEITDKYSNQVDLITGIKGMDKDVFKRSCATVFLKKKISIAGIEDFVAMKVFAGSPKDLEDARGVLAQAQDKVDKKLLKQLTGNYGKRVLQRLEAML